MKRGNLRLVEPSLEYAQAFCEFAEEFHAIGSRWYMDVLQLIHQNFPAYLKQLAQIASGENQPPGRVPQDEYWLVDTTSGAVLAAIRLRHGLTARLEEIDGQIGYNVRPTARNKGYATQMLAMLLEKMRADGWQRVLVTCNADNLASARVIENNGGRRENQVIEPGNGRLISRYWIELSDS